MSDEKMIQWLEARLQDNPKSLFFARLADCYVKQGRLDEAIELCEEGVKHHPSYVTGNFILAKAYLAKNDREKAEAEFKKVLSHDRQYLAAHRELGDLMARTGWENKAIMHYKDILQIDPGDNDTHLMYQKLTYEGEPLEPPQTVEKVEEPPTPTHSEDEPLIEPVRDDDWEETLDEVFSDTELETSREEAVSQDEDHPEPSSTESELTNELVDEHEKEIFSFTESETSPDTESEEKIFPVKEEETNLELPQEDEETFKLETGENDLITEEEDILIDIDETDDETSTEEATPSIWLEEDLKEKIGEDESLIDELPSEEELTLDEKEDGAPLSPEASPGPDTSTTSSPTSFEADIQESTEEVSPLAASEELEEEITPEEENTIISPTLGEIYAAQGQYAKAIRIYEALLNDNPEEEPLYREKINELKKKTR